MKGKFNERVTPLITSAMKRACFSLSITHGPAIRNKLPEPIRTLSIWKEVVRDEFPIFLHRRGLGSAAVPAVVRRASRPPPQARCLRASQRDAGATRNRTPSLSFPNLFRPVEHFHFGSRFFRPPF